MSNVECEKCGLRGRKRVKKYTTVILCELVSISYSLLGRGMLLCALPMHNYEQNKAEPRRVKIKRLSVEQNNTGSYKMYF